VRPGPLPAADDTGGTGGGAHAEAGAERDAAAAGAPGAEAAVVYEYDAELIERRRGLTLPDPATPPHCVSGKRCCVAAAVADAPAWLAEGWHPTVLEQWEDSHARWAPSQEVRVSHRCPAARRARYEIMSLKIIHRRRRTGFEETKDFPIRINDLIAGRYQARPRPDARLPAVQGRQRRP